MATDPQNPYLQFARDPDDERDPENPYARFAARDTTVRQDATAVATGRTPSRAVPDLTRQYARGLAEAGYGTGTGVLRLADRIPGIDTDRAVEGVQRSREEMREFYGEPETGWGTAGHMAGRITGEGALLVAGGLGTRAAVGAAGRTASRAGAARAGGALERLAAPAATRRGRLGQDVLYGAPFDVTIASAGPEDAAASGLAQLLEAETMEGFREHPAGRVITEGVQRAAETPAGRVAFELGLGATGAGVIHGAAAGAGAAGRAAGRAVDPVGEAAEEGIRTFSRQGAGEAPATGLAEETMDVIGPGARVKGRGGTIIHVESVEGGVVRGKDIMGFDEEVPVSRVEVIEPIQVPVRDYDPERMVRPGEEQPTRMEGVPEDAGTGRALSEAAPEPAPPPRPLDRPTRPLTSILESPEPPATTRSAVDVATAVSRTSRTPPEDLTSIADAAGRREATRRAQLDEGRARPYDNWSDDKLMDRYLQRLRTATIEFPRAGAGSRNAMGRLSQAEKAMEEMEDALRARGMDVPDPDRAFVDVTPADFPESIGGLVETVQGRIRTGMDDDALEAALREAEDAAARSTEIEPHIRRALLAGEMAKRQGQGDRAGFIHRQLLESLGGAAIGGAAGAAIDENPYRGFALGAAVGGLTPRIARAEAADFAERGAMRAGSLGEAPGQHGDLPVSREAWERIAGRGQNPQFNLLYHVTDASTIESRGEKIWLSPDNPVGRAGNVFVVDRRKLDPGRLSFGRDGMQMFLTYEGGIPENAWVKLGERGPRSEWRFSKSEAIRGARLLSEQPEPRPRLRATHNTTAEGVRFAEEMGGIPNPSMAIHRADQPFSTMGEVSLVGRRDLVDPEAPGGPDVFDADIYSPRTPARKFETTPETETLLRELQSESRRVEGHTGISRAEQSLEQGADPAEVASDLWTSPAAHSIYLRTQGVDVPDFTGEPGTRVGVPRLEAVTEEHGGREAFEAWWRDRIQETYGAPYFETSTGRRRPFTADELSKEMGRSRDPRATEESMMFGPAKARASAARKLESLEDLEDYRTALTEKSAVQEAADAQSEMRGKVLEALNDTRDLSGVGATWEALDDLHRAVAALGRSGRRSDPAVREALERTGFQSPSDDAIQRFREYAESILDAPTQYLEAKFRRPVRLDEFSAAIVPDDTPADVVEGLMARNIEVQTYPRRNAQARTEAFDRLRGGDRKTIEAEGMLFARGGTTLTGATAGAVLDGEDRARGAMIGSALGAGVEVASAFRSLRRTVSNASKETLNAQVGRALNDPAVERVAQSFKDARRGESILSRVRSRSVTEHAQALGHYLRYKGFREPLPMERFGEEVGKSKELRNQLAQARGWLPAAHLHVEKAWQPIREMLEQTENLYDGVRAYLRSKRGLQLAEMGKETTKEQLADWRRTIERFEGIEEVQEGAEAVSAFYRDLLRMKRDAGVITPERYDAAIAEGDFYTPFIPDDVADAIRSGAGGRGKYGPNRTAGVRKMTEFLNEADIVDPMEQAILDTYEAFERVARQRVANVIGGIVESSPDEALPFLRRVQPERGPQGGITPPKAREGALVETIVDGERRWYEVTDENFYASWAGFDQVLRSQMLDVMNKTRRVMQEGVTSHPAFLVANGVRDFFVSGLQYGQRSIRRSAIEAGVGAAAGAAVDEDDRLRGAALGAGVVTGGFMAKHWGSHIARNTAAMADIIGSEATGATMGAVIGGLAGQEADDGGFMGWLQGAMIGAGVGAAGGRGARLLGRGGDRAMYEEYISAGGGNFGFYARDRRDAQRMMRLLQRQGVSPEDFINPRSWWEAIQYVGKAVETAPRLAKYKAMRAAGESTGEGIFHARDLSLDFAVKPGSKGLQAGTRAIAFFNPALQGMDKAVRLLRDPRTTAIATGTILAPTMALWAINKEDDAYWNRPLYERNVYWLVPKRLTGGPEGEFWRVPKPFELGFIYASLPERMLDYLYQQDPDQLKFSMMDAYGMYGPGNLSPTPVAGGPIMEATRGEHGYDPFRRREINPYPWKNIEPSEQYTDRTSSLAVGLGRLANISPAKIDHVLIGHTGSLGAQFLDWTSDAARKMGIDDRPAPVSSGQGLFSRFSSSPTHVTEPERAFRRQFERAERAYNTAREMVESGDTARARTYAQRHIEDLRRYEELKQVDQMLGDVWDVRRAIYDSTELEPEEKRRLLGAINERLGSALLSMSRGQGFQVPDVPGGKEPALAAPPTR